MSLKISECLHIGALKHGTLIAGHNGLNRLVDQITVAELCDISNVNKYTDCLKENDLLISALSSINNDTIKMVEFIKFINQNNSSGLIIFYLGTIPQEVIQIADELEFPLIVMPTNINYSYADVIMPVAEAIVASQKTQSYFLEELIADFYSMPHSEKTLQSIISMIAKKLKISVILLNSNNVIISYYSYAENDTLHIKNIGNLIDSSFVDSDCINSIYSFEIPNSKITLKGINFSINNIETATFIVLENDNEIIEKQKINQACDMIRIFINIWQSDPYLNKDKSIIDILYNQNVGNLNQYFDDNYIVDIQCSIIITDKNNTLSRANESIDKIYVLAVANKIAQAIGIDIFSSFYNQYLIIIVHRTIIDFPDFKKTIIEFVDRITNKIESKLDLNLFAGIDFNVNNNESLKDNIMFIQDLPANARVIYPLRKNFFNGHLLLVDSCMNLIEKQKMMAIKKASILYPLKKHDMENNTDYLKTMETILLDADGSLSIASSQMFLHINSIKYRIKRINVILNCDFMQWPVVIAYTTALALNKLLENKT